MKAIHKKTETIEPLTVGGIHVMEEKVINKKQQKEIEEAKKAAWQRRKIRLSLFFGALIFSATLFLFKCNIWVSLIPIFIHVLLLFYSFALVHYRKRKEARIWAAYLKKYGGKMGCAPDEIHPHIQVTHKMLIKQGKEIPL